LAGVCRWSASASRQSGDGQPAWQPERGRPLLELCPLPLPATWALETSLPTRCSRSIVEASPLAQNRSRPLPVSGLIAQERQHLVQAPEAPAISGLDVLDLALPFNRVLDQISAFLAPQADEKGCILERRCHRRREQPPRRSDRRRQACAVRRAASASLEKTSSSRSGPLSCAPILPKLFAGVEQKILYREHLAALDGHHLYAAVLP